MENNQVSSQEFDDFRDEMRLKFNEQKKTMDAILQLLKGNPINKADKGLLGMIHDNDTRLITLEKWRDRIVWSLAGGFIPATAGLWKLISDMFKK